MCGIAGVVGMDDQSRARAAVRLMVDSLRRRGPDDEGIEVWEDAVLGHRRLAIFDLSAAGHQPMVHADRSIAVVFNGAIYNFRDLRDELSGRGYSFRSRTDTEVLLHGYHAWGIDALVQRLRGMFAFALWDAKARKLFLVRDRLGVKPLFFVARGTRLAFASTARALRHAGQAAEVDDVTVAAFLQCGFVPETRSIYRHVYKVPAASIVEWQAGRMRTREYWSPPASDGRNLRFEEVVEDTERRFLDAVRVRLEADVPVGALLSGGIDSSLVCWAVRELGAEITAFTVGVPDDPWDESADAAATAQALGLRHQMVEISGLEEPPLEELLSAYAEPFACSSALGMLRVCRAMQPHVKVILTGDGGDDVFLGYRSQRYVWLAEKVARAMPSAAAEAWTSLRPSLQPGRSSGRLSRFLDCAFGGLGAYNSAGGGLPKYECEGWLGERLLLTKGHWEAPARSLDAARSIVKDFQEQHRRGQFIAEYMTKVDGASMHYSLEARSPFLDQYLWESAWAVPADVRLRRGRLKAVLREIARRRINVETARRRKRGFGIPVERWTAGRWREAVEYALRDSLLEREGYIRSPALLRQLRRSTESGWAPTVLWYVFVLESWMRAEEARAPAPVALYVS